MGIFSKNRRNLVFGPAAIAALSKRANELVYALQSERVYIDNQGQWQDEASPAYWFFAYFVVAIKTAFGSDCVGHIEKKSGLPFDRFIGQVVLWWLPQRRRVGLLRALAHRLDTHDVGLKLHWNRGRYIQPTFRRPPFSLQVTSTLLGFVIGLFCYQQFHFDQVFGFLCAGLGYVGSDIYRRTRYQTFCGDTLCRSRVKGNECTFCGSQVKRERV